MRKKNERITELGGLLDALCLGQFGSNKIHAYVRYFKLLSECAVTEFFDSGKGDSEAFSSETTPVDIPVFEEAERLGYVSGKHKPGYVSSVEFVLTTNKQLFDQIYSIVKDWREREYWKKCSALEVENGIGSGTYIKITQAPEGEAPEWVRKAWIGLILAADQTVAYQSAKVCSYSVPQKEALEMLRSRNQGAADWWKKNGFPKEDEKNNRFYFSGHEVEEIAGVFFHQKIPVIPENTNKD